MKKLFTLIIVASLALTIQAQDITNTLSTTGDFKVNLNGGTNLFTISHDDNHILQLNNYQNAFIINNAGGEAAFSFDDSYNIADLAMIRIGHAEDNWLGSQFAHLQLQSAGTANKFNLVSRGTNNFINGYYANGDASGPTNVADDDVLLTLNGIGYYSGTHSTAAYIDFIVDGTPSGPVPGKIDFSTNSSSGTPAVHMSIKSDGTVNIVKELDVDGAADFAGDLDVAGTVNFASVNMAYEMGASTTLDDTHYLYATQNGATVTLPTAVGIEGRVYIIKLITETSTASVATTSGQLIDGATTYSLTAQYKYVKVQSTGGAWLIIGQN